MPRVLADKRIKLAWLLDDEPANTDAPTAAELNENSNGGTTGGFDLSCIIATAGFNLGMSGINTAPDGGLCEGNDVQVPTGKQFAADMSAYRFYDENGQVDVEEDAFFQAAKVPGATLYVAVRRGGKLASEDFADGDEVSIYKLVSGGAGPSSDREGWEKRTLYFTVQQAWEDVWVGGNPPSTSP